MNQALVQRSVIDYSSVGEYPAQEEFPFPLNAAKWNLGSFALTAAIAPFMWINTPIRVQDYRPNYSLIQKSEGAFAQPKVSFVDILPDYSTSRFVAFESSKLEAEFNERADRWEKETAVHSSPGSTYLHKDYISIMAKGAENKAAIVPLILKRLPNAGTDWFFALQYIAGENPAKDATDYPNAIKAWRNWAKQNGLIEDADEVLAS